MQYHVHYHFWIDAESPQQAAQIAMTEVISKSDQREFDDGLVFRVDEDQQQIPNPDQCYWIMPDGSVSNASTGK